MRSQTKATRGVARESIGYFAGRAMKGERDVGMALENAVSADASSLFSIPGSTPMNRSEHAENVDHKAYPMPPQWGEPSYQVTRVSVGLTPPNGNLMSHSGEEIYYPVSGPAIQYEFYWPRGKEDLLTVSVPRGIEVGSGTAIRVLPNCPHRNGTPTGTTTEEKAEAWMVLRHLGGSNAQIAGVAKDDEPEGKPGMYTLQQLHDDTRSFLLLSDIPGRLKVARMRAGYSVTELGKECNIHPSYIWRLERGATNLSIHTLAALAGKVGLDLSNLGIPRYFPSGRIGTDEDPISDFEQYQPYLSEQNTEMHQLDDVNFPGVNWRPLLEKSAEVHYDHWIHGHIFHIERGRALRLACKPCDDTSPSPQPALDTYLGPFGRQSWIVLDGKLTFVSDKDRNGIQKQLLLSPQFDPVIHFRNRAAGLLHADTDCTLLHIEHSGFCSCKRPRLLSDSQI